MTENHSIICMLIVLELESHEQRESGHLQRLLGCSSAPEGCTLTLTTRQSLAPPLATKAKCNNDIHTSDINFKCTIYKIVHTVKYSYDAVFRTHLVLSA